MCVCVGSHDRDNDFCGIINGVLGGVTLVLYRLIICQDYVLQTSIELKKNGFILRKTRNRRYPTDTMTDAAYEDDLDILSNNQSKPNPCCISCSEQQEALSST